MYAHVRDLMARAGANGLGTITNLEKMAAFLKVSYGVRFMVKNMKSDPRLNWHFESSSRYSGLSRCVPSSSRRLPRSSRRELGLFVSSPTSSSRQLPRSSRRDLTCRHRVRLVDS